MTTGAVVGCDEMDGCGDVEGAKEGSCVVVGPAETDGLDAAGVTVGRTAVGSLFGVRVVGLLVVGVLVGFLVGLF